MCDYSLENYRSRPAQVGEKYVLTRFPSRSLGFASPGDCATAVCVPYDTTLRLEDIPEDLQDELGVAPQEEVTFARVDSGSYRDGVRFANGTETSLQDLTPGITAVVSRPLGRTAPRFRTVPALETV